MSPAELAELLRAMATLTVACQAFVVAAERLYPHLKLDLRLPWQVARDTEGDLTQGEEPTL